MGKIGDVAPKSPGIHIQGANYIYCKGVKEGVIRRQPLFF